MNDPIWFEPVTLVSQRVSEDGQYSVPMEGCSGQYVLMWVRLPHSGVSMLLGMRPAILGGAA